MGKWGKFAGLIKVFAPLVISTVKPSLVPVADVIVDAVNEAEQIAGAPGLDKLKHVQKIVTDSVKVSNASGKTNINVSELDQHVDEAVAAVIKVVNTVNTDKK